ncbi:MAG: RlmE family RNA methyltransferase [Desulfovibrionales bacterium]
MKNYRDHYFKQAKAQNYPARSVFKLKEMDKRFKLFKPGQKVLDLGAAPGSWSLYAAQRVGQEGIVVAVDLQEMETGGGNIRSFQDDVFEPSEALVHLLDELAPFDLVISDMAPKTTGIKFADQARSFDLAMQALALARERLIKGGHFVVKVFEGPDIRELHSEMRTLFEKVRSFKPKSSRAESKEMFSIGLGMSK